jgi:hypothetical protein
MAYIYSLADTWNASGTTFTGIGLNVTDSASAAGSLLMDLQVGGSSQFSISKTGETQWRSGGAVQVYAKVRAGNAFSLYNTAGLGFFDVQPGGITLRNVSSFGFSPNSDPTTAGSDTILTRDAANTLAQRNGVNAQAFNLYNTYTDASNYERARVAWVSNGLVIGTQPAGTGTPRGISLDVGGTATRLDLGGGIITFINAALNLGGITSAFPALKRSTTTMQVRLADDSAFTNIQGKLTTDTAYTAGAPTATGYIVLFDSTGTAYRVPAVAN